MLIKFFAQKKNVGKFDLSGRSLCRRLALEACLGKCLCSGDVTTRIQTSHFWSLADNYEDFLSYETCNMPNLIPHAMTPLIFNNKPCSYTASVTTNKLN